GDQDPAMQFTAFVLRPDGNASRFESAEYRRLVELARTESDWLQRLAMYRAIATLIKNEAFLLPIAKSINVWGVRNNRQGVTRQPLVGDPSLAETYVVA